MVVSERLRDREVGGGGSSAGEPASAVMLIPLMMERVAAERRHRVFDGCASKRRG
jgi:hypothetical protein